jgi:hypothetical protein
MVGTNKDASDKFDHSDHPIDRKLPDDLHVPNDADPGRADGENERNGRSEPVNHGA